MEWKRGRTAECQMRKEMESKVKRVAQPDRRVRAAPRNKLTQTERQEHESTHVPFRDCRTHCMMDRGRTHHHVTKQNKRDQSRRPTTATDPDSMKMNSVVKAENISEESVTCIAASDHNEQCCTE